MDNTETQSTLDTKHKMKTHETIKMSNTDPTKTTNTNKQTNKTIKMSNTDPTKNQKPKQNKTKQNGYLRLK